MVQDFSRRAFFLKPGAAHVPPFSFVPHKKTAETWQRNRQKEKSCFPCDPTTFSPAKLTPTTRPPCPVVMPFAFAGYQMRFRARRFSSAVVKNKSKRRDTSGEHQKNAYEKSNSS